MADKNDCFDPINWNREEYNAVNNAFNNIVEVLAVINNETEISEVTVPSNQVHVQEVEVLRNRFPLGINQDGQICLPQNMDQMASNMNQMGQQAFMPQVHQNYNLCGNNNGAELQSNVSSNSSDPANPLEITRFFNNISKQLVEDRISVGDFNDIKSKLFEILPQSNEADKEEKLSLIRVRVNND